MNPVDPHPPMTQPGAPMTPERAAYLRAQYAHANSVMGEALDEIERLRGLVEVGHIIVVGPILDPSGRWWSECSCDDEFYVQATGSNKPTPQQEHAALAAHVAAILDGSGT